MRSRSNDDVFVTRVQYYICKGRFHHGAQQLHAGDNPAISLKSIEHDNEVLVLLGYVIGRCYLVCLRYMQDEQGMC